MGKLTDDQLRFIIDIEANGAQGQINTLNAEIGKLEKQTASLTASLSKVNNELEKQEKKLAKMEAAGKQNTTAYKQLAQSIEANRQKQAQLSTQLKQTQNALDKDREKVAQFTSSLKLNQMTMQQLRERASQLRKQLDVTSKAASPDTYKRLSSELAKTETQMGKLSKKSQSLNSMLLTAGGTIMGLMGKRVLMGLWDSFRNGIDTITSFESANASLAAVLGTTLDGVQRLTADAKRLGEITEYSASQVTMMQTELAKLGFNEQEILDSTQYILQFATATGSDIPAAAQLAGAAMRAFGLEATEMQRVVSAMGVATTKSALDFTYLQNSMSTIAPVANAFGFTIEDTTALLGTLANSGFDASSAATATRNILLNLADSSGKLAQALGKPIKSLDDLAPALQELQEKGVSLNEALELTDKRSVAAFETFLNGADAITTLRDSITGVGDDLAAMQQTKLDTVEGSIKLMQSAWEGLMLQFYNSKGVFKDIIDITIQIITGIRNLVKWVQDNARAIKILIGVLTLYLATGKAITLWRAADIKAIIAQTKARIAETAATISAKNAHELLKKSLLASPYGLVAAAIAAIITGLIALVKWLNKASVTQEAFNKTQDRAKELASQNTESVRAEKSALIALVGAIVETNENEKLRADLIKQLREQYPEFLKGVKDEVLTNELLKGALANANHEYERRITLINEQAKAQAYQETLVDLNKTLIEQEQELTKAKSNSDKNDARKAIEETQKAIEAMQKGYEQAVVSVKKAEQDLEHFNSLEGMSARMDSLIDNIAQKRQLADRQTVKEQKQFYADQADQLEAELAALTVQYNNAKAEADKQAAADKKKQQQEEQKLTDEAYKKAFKSLQDSYAARKAEIIQQEAAMTITAEQSKRKQLELAKEEADAELAFARKHHQETGDLQVKAANATMALNKDNYSRMEKDLQNWLSDSLRDEQEAYEKGEINQDMYNQNVRDIRTQHLNELKALMEQYGMDTSDIERKIAENEIKNRKEADKEILEAAKIARKEALKLNKQNEENELALLEEKHRLGLATDTQYEMQRRQITDVYAKERLGIEQIYYEAVKNLDAQTVAAAQQAVADATAALDDTLQDRLAKAREYTSELRDIFAETAAACGDTLGGQLMDNMANAMDSIAQFQEQLATGTMDMGQKIAAGVQMVGQVASQALQAASQITQQIFEMEANQLEAAKQKELAAVGDNAEEKERIEQEYAQKELDLKKKQADADAAIQTSNLWINTAMGIATAWATSMQLGPIAGPIMAAILTAALLTTAGIQQANIIAQRDAIKNQTLESSGGSSAGINESAAPVSTTTIRDEFKPGGQGYSDGGYTGDGGVHEPAGIVHKGEYVVSQAELRNPSVVPMVRAIEGVRQSRKHGRAGVHGFADGGYTDTGGVSESVLGIIQSLADQVDEMKSKTLHADLNYHQFKQTEKKMDNIKAKGSL